LKPPLEKSCVEYNLMTPTLLSPQKLHSHSVLAQQAVPRSIVLLAAPVESQMKEMTANLAQKRRVDDGLGVKKRASQRGRPTQRNIGHNSLRR
jgi:hypothetical protein